MYRVDTASHSVDTDGKNSNSSTLQYTESHGSVETSVDVDGAEEILAFEREILTPRQNPNTAHSETMTQALVSGRHRLYQHLQYRR